MMGMLDAMARRYTGKTPGDWVAPDHLHPTARAWFDWILAWGCIEAADRRMQQAILMHNSRDAWVFPTLPLTDMPK